MATLGRAAAGLWGAVPRAVVLSIGPRLVFPALKTDVDSKPELTPQPSVLLLTFLKIAGGRAGSRPHFEPCAKAIECPILVSCKAAPESAKVQL